jgi:hypothetical protein
MMSAMRHEYHVIATVHLALDVDKPKINGVRSGYAPHHKFTMLDYLVSGFHLYEDQCLHYPGETMKAWIGFPSWKYFREKMKIGDSFKVQEVNRIVGYGIIDEIL